MTFNTVQEADNHMDTGQHKMKPHHVYDYIRKEWAATTLSVKGGNKRIDAQCFEISPTISKYKPTTRISPQVKEYLIHVFNEGTKHGNSKANPSDVAEEIKSLYNICEWLEEQSIKAFFS